MSQESELQVIFGAGPVGLAVAEALTAGGQRVRLVHRSGNAAAPDGVEVLAGDASDPADTRRLCQGASVVYNCTNPPYHQWPEKFPALQQGVLQGAAAAGARLVVMENLYMYGPTGGKPLTEDLPYNATTRKGRVRAQMAAELLAAHTSGKVRVTIGRASDFFGPRVLESAMGERVFAALLAGKPAQVLGNPDLPHTYTYVPDIGKALVLLGQRDEALGQAWHIPAAETLSTRRFIEKIASVAGMQPRVQAAPRLLLQGLGLFNPSVRELIEMLYEFEEPFVVDDSRFVRTFGNLATSLDTAIRATVDWYRHS